jgi:murein DD-endopeptidase MepM/ murein hydrolase activator NlpD
MSQNTRFQLRVPCHHAKDPPCPVNHRTTPDGVFTEPESAPAPARSANADAPAMSRRELRERERAALQEHVLKPRPPLEKRMPPLVAVSLDNPASPPRRRWLRKTLSVSALAFAALIAIATTVPAAAFLSRQDVEAAALVGADVVAPSATQALATVQSAAESIVRERFAVTSAEQAAALLQMRTADTFTNDPNGSVQWPFPVGVPIADGFGPRVAPTDGASTFHEGVDFDPGSGVPIQIIADGVVRQVFPADDNGCGVHVVIDHVIKGQPVSSVYCHMQVGSVRVAEGQHVKVGDIVGQVGNTGVSTGAHLHFEIRLNGTTAVDPLVWLKANAN